MHAQHVQLTAIGIEYNLKSIDPVLRSISLKYDPIQRQGGILYTTWYIWQVDDMHVI